MRSIDKESFVENLKELVSIDSPYLKEAKSMKWIKEKLDSFGLPSEYHYYEEMEILKYKGINVVGKLKGTKKGTKILLNAHLDTVGVTEGWSSDPLQPLIKDGKLYGLGALDMKAGAVAILLALKQFSDDFKDFSGEIIYTFVSDEEGPYGLGTDALILDKITKGIDVSLVTEPSAGFTGLPFPTLCLGARGGLSYTVRVKGKASHAADPHKGLSAINQASKLILELEKTDGLKDEKLGNGDFCVISIEGGGAACSVAEKAQFTVFRHIVRGEDKEYVEREVYQAAKRAGIEAQIEVEFRVSPHKDNGGFLPYVVDEDNKYSKSLIKAIEETTGKACNISYFSSIGDFNYLGTRVDVPTFVFGPAGQNYHTKDEYVDIESAVETAEVIYEYLKKLLV